MSPERAPQDSDEDLVSDEGRVAAGVSDGLDGELNDLIQNRFWTKNRKSQTYSDWMGVYFGIV